jgi:hypothetical protein
MNITSPDATRKKALLPFVGVVVLLAALLTIAFGGAPALRKDTVLHRLQQFSAYIAASSATAGREGKFSTGDIDMIGWGVNQYALVKNISLEFAEKSVLDTRRWTFSTRSMQVQGNPQGDLIFAFTDPINVIESSQVKTTITFPSPPVYVYSQSPIDTSSAITHTLQLPPQVEFTPPRTADVQLEKSVPVTVSYAPNPLLRIRIFPDTGIREADYEFHDVRINSVGSKASIGYIVSHRSEMPKEDKTFEGQYTLTVSDAVIAGNSTEPKTYNVNADLNYTSNQPSNIFGLLLPGQGDFDVKVNRLVLAGDNFKVSADGNFTRSADDILPAGEIMLSVTNVKQFVASELIPDSARKSVQSVVEKVTGKPISALTDITVPVKREKGGTLYIADVSIEEIAAMLFADMIHFPH